MKIAVISDTHSLPIPKKLLTVLSTVDLIIHAGDLCDLEILRLLQKINKVIAVQGNMCDSAIKKKLPLKEIVEAEGVRIGVCHGHGASLDALTNAKMQFAGNVVNIVIFGHSHHALNKTIDNVLYFNPGSPNDLIKAKFFSYGLIDIQKGVFKAEIIKI